MEKDLRDLIQNGYIVTTRNGNEYIRVGEILRRSEGAEALDNFEPNGNNMNSSNYDIMSIHTPLSNRLDYRKDLLVWERPSVKVGDYVRLKKNVENVRFLFPDASDVIRATEPIFKVVSTNDNRIKVGCGIIFDAEQFEKVDLYENE